MMKKILAFSFCILWALNFSQAQAVGLDCETDFVVSGFAFNSPISPVSPITCALPDKEGLNDLTARLSNQDLIQTINNLSAGACWAFNWEVTGGTILLPDGNGDFFDAGSSTCVGEIVGFQGFQNCSLCGSINNSGLNSSNFPGSSFLSSTVRIKWDNVTDNPDTKYGVKVKVSIQSSTKFSIKIKKLIFPGIFKDVKINVKQNSKRKLCETFIPYGFDTRQIEDIVAVSTSCVNNGTRELELNLSDIIDRCGPDHGIDFRWERKIGNQAFQWWTGNGPTRTMSDFTLNMPHTVRVTPRYFGFPGEPFEKEFPPIQGNTSLGGPTDVYPNGGDVLGTLYETIGINNPVWNIIPSALNDPFYFQVSGNTAVLFEPPIGGTATISATGTSITCGNTVTVYKNICIHGIPPGPSNSACSSPLVSNSDGDENTEQGNQQLNNSSEASGDYMQELKQDKFNLYPTVLVSGQPLQVVTQNHQYTWNQQDRFGINVYNLAGKQMLQINNQELGTNLELSTNKLKSGIYFVEFLVNNGQDRVIKRIVIQ